MWWNNHCLNTLWLYRIMHHLSNIAVIESKRQVTWFHSTETMTTQTLRHVARFSRVQGTHIHFDWHSRSAEDYKVYPLHCYLLFFSAAFWLSRTLCFFKEVKASLRMLWERKCAWLLMLDKSFSLRIMSILYITAFVIISVRRQSASITVRIVAQRNVLSAQESAWVYCRVTVGYCFLLAPKYKRFSLLLTCWIVSVVFRAVRKPVPLTKYVAHCWLRLVRSVNS